MDDLAISEEQLGLDELAVFVAKNGTGANGEMTLEEQLDALAGYGPLVDRCREVMVKDRGIRLDAIAMRGVCGLVAEMMVRQFRHDYTACQKAMDAVVGHIDEG